MVASNNSTQVVVEVAEGTQVVAEAAAETLSQRERQKQGRGMPRVPRASKAELLTTWDRSSR